MCQFPSWYERDNEVRFLTDKDVKVLIENESIKQWEDGVGHEAIRKMYDGCEGWEQKELFPCPGPVAAAIRQGKMAKMMKAAGLVAVYINSDGKLHRADGPAVERADGSKEWYRDGQLHRADGPAVEWANCCKEWYRDGQRHRADGPAVEQANGDKEWYRDGKLHRVDGPAVEWANGDKEWYRDGKLHRVDGPAVEWANCCEVWYRDGQRHRADGPAVEEVDGYKAWYQDGQLHRADGPAIEWADGDKAWYLNGMEVTEEEVNKKNKEKEMNIRPIGDKVVVQPIKMERQVGSIIIPDIVKEKPQIGLVVAVGNDSNVNVGDKIIYTLYSGNEIEVDNEKYLVIAKDNVLATLE